MMDLRFVQLFVVELNRRIPAIGAISPAQKLVATVCIFLRMFVVHYVKSPFVGVVCVQAVAVGLHSRKGRILHGLSLLNDSRCCFWGFVAQFLVFERLLFLTL